MRRREFITLLGGTAAAWPLAGRAQTAGKLPTIGLLIPGTRALQRPWFASLVQRLNELGWSEGRTVAIEYRYADGRAELYDEIAAELVRLKVDLIVTTGPASPTSKKGDVGHTNCPPADRRPCCRRLGCESRATRRQRHRPVDHAARTCQQTARTFARGRP